MVNLECPHCGSTNVLFADECDSEMCLDECYALQYYRCSNCDQEFYVNITAKVTEVSVAKDKYDDYNVVYKVDD